MTPVMEDSLRKVVIGLQRVVNEPCTIILTQEETSLENLNWMCNTILEKMNDLPEDKINRWIGFVQGVLAVKGCLSVADERDRTRPLFHAAYASQGVEIPESLNKA